jgi:hypothetical protein
MAVAEHPGLTHPTLRSVLWWLWGWVFVRWMIGLQWRHYRWFLRFGLRVVAGPFSQYCRHCGFEFDFFEKPWFVCYQSGYYNTDHSGPVHWVCGIQTCPRCHHRDAVEDSS